MKKFTKIMLSVAAVTAVSTAMAISAMAEDTVTGTYNNDTGEVTLAGVVSSGDQQTLLVLTEDAKTVTEGIIAQIDQQESISKFILPAGLADDDDPEVTYYIRIGGTDGTMQTGTLTIGSQGGGETETVTIIIGDVNLDGSIKANDSTFLARQQAKYTANIGQVGAEKKEAGTGTTIIIGDVNLDGSIKANDSTFLARQQAKYTANIGQVGAEKTVEK